MADARALCDEAEAVAAAARELSGVADKLALCLGSDHAQTHVAQANLAVARQAQADAAAGKVVSALPWRQHWLPCLGVGLGASSAPAWRPEVGASPAGAGVGR